MSGKIDSTLRSIGLLFLGAIAGWLIHDYQRPEPTQSGIANESPGAELSDGSDPVQLVRNPVIASFPSLPTPVTDTLNPDPQTQGPDQHSENVIVALASADYDRAVSLCIQLIDQGRRQCRALILEYSDSPATTRAETRFLLELWLAENPDDVEAGSILVNQAIADERFVDAVERLAMLKSYQTDFAELDSITRKVEHLARVAIVRLTLQEDFLSLKSVLTTMIDIQPGRAVWRYELARVLQDLEQYNEAISALTYILYDTDYGHRANKLYEEVTRRVNLADYTEVPLQKSGSQLLVKALLNGTHEITLLVDTGASLTAINSEVLSQLGINPDRGRVVILNTVGGKIQSPLIKLNTFSIGGQGIQGIDVASISFKENQSDGLLGMNFLNHFKFIIDLKQRKLFLTPK